MIKKFKNIKVSGMSLVLPEKEICIYDELQYYGNSEKKAERAHKMAGFWKRRVADPDVTSADMGVQAGENLIASMGLDKSKIEAMVFVVQQPDYYGPCTSYSVHNRLGLSKDCYVTDVVQGCVGWCFGLLTAYQMVASGAYNSVLLINADTPTRGLKSSDRINAPLFGDAGLATLVEHSEGAPDTIFNLESYSDGFEAIIGLIAGGVGGAGGRLHLDIRKPDECAQLVEMFQTKNGRTACLAEGYMDGPAVFEFSTQKVPENLKSIMSEIGTTPDSYDLLALHQANKQIVQTVGGNAGFPLDKVPFSGFENFGNNTMCSIPATLLQEKGEVLRNGGTVHTLACGFGNGLVVCSVDLSLEGLKCADMKSYVKLANHKTSAEWVAYWRDKFINT